MNTALKATSVRDLKDAARAIQFVLKNKIKGKAAVAALCDLLEVTARTVREESVGYVPHAVRKAVAKGYRRNTASQFLDRNYIGPVVVDGYRKKRDGTTTHWNRRFKDAATADEYIAKNANVHVDYALPADCNR